MALQSHWKFLIKINFLEYLEAQLNTSRPIKDPLTTTNAPQNLIVVVGTYGKIKGMVRYG